MALAAWNIRDYDYRNEVDDVEIADDTALILGPFTNAPDPSEVNFGGAQEWLTLILRQAHLRYFRRRHDQALSLYLSALEFLTDYLRESPLGNHSDDEFTWLRDRRFLALPMCIGDTYAKMGAFEDATKGYIGASKYPGAAPAVTWSMIWNRAAEATVEAADLLYRGKNTTAARAKYETLFERTSPLFTGSYLRNLHPQVEAIRASLNDEDPQGLREIDHEGRTPLFLAVIARADARLAQLDRGEDYFGLSDNDIPMMRFDRLKDVARSFAQMASRANREYLSFLSNAEQQAYSVENLRRAAEVEEEGVQVEVANYNSASAEVRAADEALTSAEERERLAQAAYSDYNDRGWRIALLDELQAWAGSASGNSRKKLGVAGYESLGLQGGFVLAQDRIHEIASKRARTSFRLRRDELYRQVQVRRVEVELVEKQADAARARRRAANARIQAARARLNAAQASYLSFQNNVTKARLYFELADEVERSARLYLNRAIQVAHVMERAFNVEYGVQVGRIKGDYGDLRGAGSILAADRLTGDIDFLDFHRAVDIKDKRQNAVLLLSIASDFPIEFRRLKNTGEAEFALTLDAIYRRFPGIYNARVKRVLVEFAGYYKNKRPNGSLSCGAMSQYRVYRPEAGSFNTTSRLHGSETMMLSDFRLAKDSFVLPPIRDQLSIFENVGLDTSWLLKLPLWLNDFRRVELLDVEIHLAFECQHDTILMAKDVDAYQAEATALTPVVLSEVLEDEKAMVSLGQGRALTFTIPEAQIAPYYHEPRIERVQAYLSAAIGAVPEDLTVHLYRAGEDPGVVNVDADGRAYFQNNSAVPYFLGANPTSEWTLQLARRGGGNLSEDWLEDVVFALEINYKVNP